MVVGGAQWRGLSLPCDPAARARCNPRLPDYGLAGVAHRPLEAWPMKLEKRFTSVHQSMTFSRRMMLMRGAQLGVGGLLLGRLGWLSVAENEKYSLESESNRVQLIIVPPRRGWI